MNQIQIEKMNKENNAPRFEVGVRMDLLYGDFLIEMGKIMSVGARKYGENNWRKPGLDGDKSGANHALCHLMEYLENKPNDYGPREMHLAQVAVNAMFEFYHYRLRQKQAK
jgi:hypothetical protein